MIYDIVSAFSLLTILPLPSAWVRAGRPLARAMAAYPLVGLALGGALGWGWQALNERLPFLALAALILAAWAVLTGGLHLDGWADCCDALPATVTRERRLEILRDPRLGSFGGVGLGLLMIAKFAAIASLHDPWPLVLAPILGRWAIVNVAASFPLARAEGMAARFRAGLGRRELTWAAITAALACGALGWAGLIAFAAAAGLAWGLGEWATRRLGGVTGDVYGAACELVECGVLFTLLMD